MTAWVIILAWLIIIAVVLKIHLHVTRETPKKNKNCNICKHCNGYTKCINCFQYGNLPFFEPIEK
jgi:hypothetical protein